MDYPQILLHHLLQEYWKGHKLHWDAHFKCSVGLRIDKGWGASCPGRFILPPPPTRISERIDNTQILLHHLLQEYLIERDINFISVNLRCLLHTFSWVTYWQGVGGGASCPGRFILPPAQNFRENGWSTNFITPSTTGIFNWKGCKLYFSQSEMLTSNVQLGYVLTRGRGQAVHKLHWDAHFKCSVGLRIEKGWGASCPGRFILPPPPPRPEFQREFIIRKFY